jgi:hypothetical protein
MINQYHTPRGKRADPYRESVDGEAIDDVRRTGTVSIPDGALAASIPGSCAGELGECA